MIHGGFVDIARDLSVCLNPLGPPPEVVQWWQNPSNVWMRYPEAYADRARSVLAPRLGVDPGCFLLGNGCGELFSLALKALGITEAVQIRPCYGGYAESAALAGVNLHAIDLPLSLWGARTLHQSKFEKALRQIAADLSEDFRGALFLGNPNNPDGRQLPWKEVETLAQMIPHGFVFLDQSYMDFIELPGQNLGFRAPELLPHNVLVFQSFTKFFCLAGVRLACVYGGPRPVARLRNRQLPWTVNGPAQEMAQLLYTHESWLKQAQGHWKIALQAIQHEYSAKGVQPCTRHVPWLFGQLPSHIPGDSFLRDCLSQGSAVRVFQGGPEGLNHYVRIGLPLEAYDT